MASTGAISIPLERLLPSQIRYSSKNVQDKIANGLKKGFITSHPLDGFQLSFDNAQSMYPKNEAVPVLKLPNEQFLLVDGHHSALASLEVGAKTIFGKVIEEIQKPLSAPLWHYLEGKGWAYLKELGGKPSSPPQSFSDLKDDPVRYFVTLSRCKVDEDLDLSKARGFSFPLWLKIGKDQPFIEFKIADYLYAHGFRASYDSLQNEENLGEVVEKARLIFQRHPTSEFRILYERSHFSESKEIPRLSQ